MIKQQAGDPTVARLSLTKSEVWSVPPAKVDAVKNAAARHGIGVQALPRIGTMSRVMPPHMTSDDEHKAMMAQAKSSRAPSGSA